VAALRLLRILSRPAPALDGLLIPKAPCHCARSKLNQGTPGTMGAAVARPEQEGRDEEGGEARTVKFKEEEEEEGDEEDDRKRARARAPLQYCDVQ
jgi:hypothetical protein